MAKLILLFTILPFVELFLLIQIGERVGAWPTIGILLVTGVVGAALARREGLRVIRDWRAALASGRLPETGVMQGLLVLVGAVLLLTPGVLTDIVGLLLLVPPTRRFVAARLQKRLIARFHLRPMPRHGDHAPARDQTIDVEGRTVDDKPHTERDENPAPPDEKR